MLFIMVPLHVAKSITELEAIAEVKIPDLKLSLCLEKMKIMNESARKANLSKDQEREFMFLHRYFLIMTKAKSFPEFTKASYRSEYQCTRTNFIKYESLKNILEIRYEEKSCNEKNSKPPVKPTGHVGSTEEKSLKNLTNNKTAAIANKKSIKSEELYFLYNLKDRQKESFLIIDARSTEDFKESHLNIPNVINIPEEIIKHGSSAASISKSLTDLKVKEQWGTRGSVNKLIIFDWNSTEKSINSKVKLFNLRDAMCQWDPHTLYLCSPLILEGGYEDLLAKYPHITTNPKVRPPFIYTISIPSLDSFDYPMQVLEPEVKKPQTLIVTQSKPEVNDTLVIDRSTKPAQQEASEEKIVKPTTEEKSEEAIEDEDSKPTPEDEVEVSSQNEENVAPLTVEEEPLAEEKPVDPKDMLDLLRKVKPDIPVNTKEKNKGTETICKINPEKDISEKRTPEKRPTEGISHVPLKKDDGPSGGGILKRTSSSPNIAQMNDEGRIPNFSRATKPAYAERTDSTYGKTEAGLTGLKNFANNCYMNSILQCLSNTKPLVSELISINKQIPINYQSKTKGKIAQEVVSAFRNIWSGDVKVYSIKDLKNIMGGLKEIFKGTGHQDSNEFLIILLEYLHDDLNIPANVESRLDGAKEETGEKAWGEFRRKNCSIIQRLFYGQHRSTVSCSTCRHSSVTFEQFFNLFVPIPSKDSVTLNECIQLYMSGEKISGWKCPKCKEERNATKKFDISRLPPILVIALKRFTNEDDSWLQKKENLVTYPLEGLDMERFTVEGSEQRYTRYNLYAMSTHTGTLRAGHYKAICRNYQSDKWFMFDDQSIDPLPSHSVRNIPEVYILFYSAELNIC